MARTPLGFPEDFAPPENKYEIPVRFNKKWRSQTMFMFFQRDYYFRLFILQYTQVKLVKLTTVPPFVA